MRNGDSMETSAAREILDYEREVAEALRRLRRRTKYEPATVDTPMYDVLGASVDGSLDEWSIRNETVRKLFEYFLGDGPHPAQILRRIFAIGAHMMIEPFCLLNLRERALMMGDSHGAQHWRTKRICTDPLMRKGALSVKAPGQKGAAASAAASEAQQGNHNRANAHGGAGKRKKTKRRKP